MKHWTCSWDSTFVSLPSLTSSHVECLTLASDLELSWSVSLDPSLLNLTLLVTPLSWSWSNSMDFRVFCNLARWISCNVSTDLIGLTGTILGEVEISGNSEIDKKHLKQLATLMVYYCLTIVIDEFFRQDPKSPLQEFVRSSLWGFNDVTISTKKNHN